MKRFLCKVFTTITPLALLSSSLMANEKSEKAPVVIVGGGVGALTSAIYLQRAGVETIVLEGKEPGGAIAQSPSVHNWPGDVEISGRDLAKKIKSQAAFNGAKFLPYEATSLDFSKRPFKIQAQDPYDASKTVLLEASACLIAVGSKPNLLGVTGEATYWTKGVYSCAVCDGGLYKGQTVAVIGGGDSAIIEAEYLSNLAQKVYLILRSDKFRTVEGKRKEHLIKKGNVEVLYNTKVEEILGNGKVATHLKLSTGKTLPVNGIFLAIGAKPNTALLKNGVALDEQGYIRLIKGQQTSVPGVFAIGDATDPIYKQAITAAGDGAKAALDLEKYLSATEPVYKATPTLETVQIEEVRLADIPSIRDSQEFYRAISGGQDTPVLIDFYTPFCGPCQQLLSRLQLLAAQPGGKVRIVKVDVAEFQEIAGTYSISSVPTVLLFDKHGKEVKRGEGLQEIGEILTFLQSN